MNPHAVKLAIAAQLQAAGDSATAAAVMRLSPDEVEKLVRHMAAADTKRGD